MDIPNGVKKKTRTIKKKTLLIKTSSNLEWISSFDVRKNDYLKLDYLLSFCEIFVTLIKTIVFDTILKT